MTTEHIILAVQVLATAVIGIFIAYQNYILKTTIKNQNSQISNQSGLIGDLKTALEVFDIKKYKDYVSLNNEVAERKLQLEIMKTEKQKSEYKTQMDKEFERQKNTTIEKEEIINEMTYIFSQLLMWVYRDPAERNAVMNKRLPKSNRLLLKSIALIEFIDKAEKEGKLG